MIILFAMIGAIVGFIPAGSFLLIPMEVFLLYKIISKYNAFHLGEFLGLAAALIGLSTFLKGLATFIHAIPIIGQIGNSLVAFLFIMVFGYMAEQHYSKGPTPRR